MNYEQNNPNSIYRTIRSIADITSISIYKNRDEYHRKKRWKNSNIFQKAD